MPYVIASLSTSHERGAFTCGEPSLDAYIQRQARQDVQRDLAACYVLCAEGDTRIIGYYTLSASSVELTALPSDLAKKAGRYPLIPAVLLGRLAVDTRFQGQAMSTILLLDALRRVLRTGIGVKLVLVDALNERAAHFYARRQFHPFAANPLRLYITLETIRDAFPEEMGRAQTISDDAPSHG